MGKDQPIKACGTLRTRVAHELNAIRLSSRHRALRLPHPQIQTSQPRLYEAGISILQLTGSVRTVLYLAYGSNLCAATFRGARGIKPLSAVNVVVPELSLTFDLSGFPYNEPCFANTARRAADIAARTDGDPYWNKGLVGVVYEVTPEDYAYIIQTEGGGAAYTDILVDCFPLSSDPTEPVPQVPTSRPFKAHTLFAPAEPEAELFSPQAGSKASSTLDRSPRPHPPGYAQPSARYLDLLRTGGVEHNLPNEYQAYLDQLRSYTITTRRQEMGKYAVIMLWGPVLAMVLALMRTGKFNDKYGNAPGWLVKLLDVLFNGIWWSYDHVYLNAFGDGERTEGDEFVEWPDALVDEKSRLVRRGQATQGFNSEKRGPDLV